MILYLPGDEKLEGKAEKAPAGLGILCVLVGVVEHGGAPGKEVRGEGEWRPRRERAAGDSGRAGRHVGSGVRSE